MEAIYESFTSSSHYQQTLSFALNQLFFSKLCHMMILALLNLQVSLLIEANSYLYFVESMQFDYRLFYWVKVAFEHLSHLVSNYCYFIRSCGK